MHFDPKLLNGGSILIVGMNGEVPHRAWIIMEAADLEANLGEAFLAWLINTNPRVTVSEARQGLIDSGLLGSLTKLADIAYFVGMIGPKTQHDLRKVAKLRDRYAHDLHRGQLSGDPAMFKYVQDTFMYKENRSHMEAVVDLQEQRAFIAICEQLRQYIKSSWVE